MYHNVTSDNVIHPNSKRGGLIERKRGGGGGEYWALTVSRVFIFSRFYENYRNISLYQHHTSTMLPDEITRFVAAERTEKTGFTAGLTGTTGFTGTTSFTMQMENVRYSVAYCSQSISLGPYFPQRSLVPG